MILAVAASNRLPGLPARDKTPRLVAHPPIRLSFYRRCLLRAGIRCGQLPCVRPEALIWNLPTDVQHSVGQILIRRRHSWNWTPRYSPAARSRSQAPPSVRRLRPTQGGVVVGGKRQNSESSRVRADRRDTGFPCETRSSCSAVCPTARAGIGPNGSIANSPSLPLCQERPFRNQNDPQRQSGWKATDGLK
jgi:hypothetical protein